MGRVSTGDRVLQIYERSKYDIKFHIFVLPILGRIFVFFLVDQTFDLILCLFI